MKRRDGKRISFAGLVSYRTALNEPDINIFVPEAQVSSGHVQSDMYKGDFGTKFEILMELASKTALDLNALTVLHELLEQCQTEGTETLPKCTNISAAHKIRRLVLKYDCERGTFIVTGMSVPVQEFSRGDRHFKDGVIRLRVKGPCLSVQDRKLWSTLNDNCWAEILTQLDPDNPFEDANYREASATWDVNNHWQARRDAIEAILEAQYFESVPESVIDHFLSWGHLAHLLREGLSVCGSIFYMYGFSISKILNRECILCVDREFKWAMTPASRESEQLTPLKMGTRVALLFSTSVPVHVDSLSIETVEDITATQICEIQNIEKEINFTDGCGSLSEELAQEIAKQLNSCSATSDPSDPYALLVPSVPSSSSPFTPSAFQIRYAGYKGMLVVDQALSGLSIQFRKSMKKFETPELPDHATLEILGHSRPLPPLGNTQVLHLLLGCAKPNRVPALISYLAESAISEVQEFLETPNKRGAEVFDYVGLSLRSVGIPTRTALFASLWDKHFRRFRIRLPNTYFCYGVCDPTRKLDENQIFLYPSSADTPITGSIFMTRDPCYFGSDLQEYEAVDVSELRHLRDVVVFFTRGAREAAQRMSEGDLDGDYYYCFCDPVVMCSLGVTKKEGFYTHQSGEGVNLLATAFSRFHQLHLITEAQMLHMVEALIEERGIGWPSDPEILALSHLLSCMIDNPKHGTTAAYDYTLLGSCTFFLPYNFEIGAPVKWSGYLLEPVYTGMQKKLFPEVFGEENMSGFREFPELPESVDVDEVDSEFEEEWDTLGELQVNMEVEKPHQAFENIQKWCQARFSYSSQDPASLAESLCEALCPFLESLTPHTPKQFASMQIIWRKLHVLYLLRNLDKARDRVWIIFSLPTPKYFLDKYAGHVLVFSPWKRLAKPLKLVGEEDKNAFLVDFGVFVGQQMAKKLNIPGFDVLKGPLTDNWS